MGQIAASNPFSTACIRPGAIQFQFAAGETVAALLARLQSNGWRGAIVGPHGSGKSTLLAALHSAWEGYGRRPLEIALHDGQRQLASGFWQQSGVDAATQIIIDGYEQLCFVERWRLKRFCRRKGCGLLITSHREAGLPPIYRTRVHLHTVQTIVDRLTADQDWRVPPQTLRLLLNSKCGNVRELLFNLYDLYESQRKHGS